MDSMFDQRTKIGTISGTLLTVFANVGSADLLKTAILAAVGAVVSFMVSQVLKVVVKWMRRMTSDWNDV